MANQTAEGVMQLRLLNDERVKCLQQIESETKHFPASWCPIVWDKISCWPATPPGQLQTIRCPHYVYHFDYNANATRMCTKNGQWYFDAAHNTTWSNYTECILRQNNVKLHLQEHIPSYYMITVAGYSISLITLVLAFLIFTLNKRLHSPKNNLHIQLFLSFILRCVLFHIKRIFFYTIDENFNIGNGQQIEMPLACKIFTIIWQFSLLANYNWILMEAVYLHCLISFNTFNDNSSILKYVIFGWSIPVLIIIPWTLAKAIYENSECWTTNDNTYIFWIIRGPITLSIILNLVFFINIIRVLFLKIFSSGVPPNQVQRKYSKWFRSTLVLVPLFGVHYAFLLICKTLAFSPVLEITWLYFDLIFTSFQGFFVALLYCFLSVEVLQEMKKLWQRFWLRRHGDTRKARNRNRLASNTCNTLLTQSIRIHDTNNNSFGDFASLQPSPQLNRSSVKSHQVDPVRGEENILVEINRNSDRSIES